MRMPVLSIVVATRDRPADMRRLLDSIEDTVKGIPYEVVISDASKEPIEEQEVATKEMWSRIVYLPEYPPIGCTRAFNTAFRAAQGKYCLWLNDDCIVENNCVERAVRYMEENPEVGIGALPYAEPNVCSYHVNSYFGMLYANFGIIARTFGNKIGWMDEEFPMYGNDNSLTFRCLLAGKSIGIVNGARVTHFATFDRHRQENNKPDERRADGERLIRKYGPLVQQMQHAYDRRGIRGADQTPSWANDVLRT